MSKKLSGKALVVQLTSDQMRIAKTTLGAAMPQLQATFVADLPEGAVEDGVIHQLETVRDILKDALATQEFRRVKRVVFALCTTQVIAETASLPPVPLNKLDKMLESNMDMYFPVDTQNYHLTWEVIQKKNELGEMPLQLWAVSTSIVQPYYALANSCGLSVVAIDYCGHALASAVGASFAAVEQKKEKKAGKKLSLGKKPSGEEPEELTAAASVAVADAVSETELYLMAEKEHLLMLFVQDGQVKLQRMFLCGSNMELELSEVVMALDYYDSMEMGRYSSVQCTLCGALAEDEQFVLLARDILNIPVQVLPALAGPQWALCLGASRTTLDFGVPSLNKPGGTSQINNAWQYGLILAGGAALALTMVATLGSKTVWTTTINGLTSTQQSLQIQAAQNANYAQNYYNYQSAYSSYSSDWDVLFTSLRTYNDNLVLIMDELEDTLPQGTSVTGIQIADQGLGLSLASPTKEEAAYTIMALRELEYATLDFISSLTKPGTTAAAPSGYSYEAPPTVGSGYDDLLGILVQANQNNSSSKDMAELLEKLMQDGSFSKEDIAASLMDLTPEQFDALEDAYGTHPEPDKALDKLLKEALFRDRKAALTTMLNEDPFAMYRFYHLIMEDMKRPATDKKDGRKPAVLHADVYNKLFDSTEIFDLLADGVSNAKKLIPILLDALCQNEASLSSAEELMAEDQRLIDRYAYYLAVELGYEEPMDSPIDIDSIIRDFITGDTPDVDNKEDLEDALDTILPGVSDIISGSGSKDDEDEDNDSSSPSLEDILGQLGGNSGSSSSSELPDWIWDMVGGGSGSLGGGSSLAPAQPVDNRYHYNIVLGYKDALIIAERERKGLDHNAKVAELEVNG